MSMTMDMMKAMPQGSGAMQSMDPMAMQECLDALSACVQACTISADSMAASDMEGSAKCSSTCANCADVCDAMMRMMLRPSGMDMTVMMAMMQACVAMCRACMEECMAHAEMSETCRLCAQACERCMKACEAMMVSMPGAMS